MKIFSCEICGNMVEMLQESGVSMVCCGQKMTELIPGTSDGAHEKHVPVIRAAGKEVIVEIGSVEHPMTEAHHIEWIAIETTRGSHRRWLEITDRPQARFLLEEGEEVVAAYEYCNLHGLWKAEK